jgi:hypothetical protein
MDTWLGSVKVDQPRGIIIPEVFDERVFAGVTTMQLRHDQPPAIVTAYDAGDELTAIEFQCLTRRRSSRH